MNESDTMIWDSVCLEGILANVENSPLPQCNRGSWFCPIATKEDAEYVDEVLSESGISKVYDLGAGDLRFSVEMDKRGYDVVAYESIQSLTDYALTQLPSNDVTVLNRDYYEDWGDISAETAGFVAIGKLNTLPTQDHNGIGFDGMGIAPTDTNN